METLNTERYLTLNQTEAHENTSDRYAMVPTSRMLNVLADYGWHPAKVKEANTRVEGNRGFQKHVVRLRNSQFNSPITIGEYVPEIVLINSHMGSSAFQLMCGVYRLVCSNGLTVGENWSTERIVHKGYADEKAENAIRRIVQVLPEVTGKVEEFRAIGMNDSERLAFAESALELVKDADDKYSIRPDRIIQPRRWADRSDQSLWGTFNVVQENLIRGGIRRTDSVGRRSHTRQVKSIDKDLAINRALWTLTEKMAELKHVQ